MKISTKTLAYSLIVLMMAALATPLAEAQAQSATFEVKGISSIEPIVPDIEARQATVSWKYSITGNLGQIGQAESTAATLTWQSPVCTSDQIIVTGPLTETISIQSTTANAIIVDDTTVFQLSATTEAPGEQGLKCTFAGQVARVGQTVAATEQGKNDLQFSVAYYGLIQASSQGRLKEAGPQKPISYDITVTNFGNARTNVAFALGTEANGDWKTILPEPLILESKISGLGGDVQTGTFQVSTPFKNGWNNDERTFKIILTPTSAKTGTEGGNPVEVNVLARVRGVYVPSLEPIAMVGAIIGTALVARMRRE